MKRQAASPEVDVRARHWRGSLRARILIVSLLLFGAMTGALVLNSVRIIKEAMLENVRVSELQISEILNLAVASYAVSGDFGTVKAFLDELLSRDNEGAGLVYLAVGNEDGSVLLQAGALNGPLPAPDTPANYARATERGIVHFWHPLLLENNGIGFMQYGLSFRMLVDATERLNRHGILLAIAGLTLLTGVMLAIILQIVRRINLLERISLAIAQGDYSQRAPPMGRDEIGLLAMNFNRMAGAIQQRVQEAMLLNLELESRVQARTQDLVEVNATLTRTIEDLKWTQHNLVRSEKLAGLGSLVAGVAHELNTPLGNALTVASTLQDHTRTIGTELQTGLRRSSLEKFLEETATAGNLLVRNLHRAADLVTSFKHVAVDQTSEVRRDFDLCTTVEEIVATLSPVLKKTPYRLEWNVPEGIMMHSYPGALGQIVTNLVNNAIFHAFAGRAHGCMTLRAHPLPDHRLSLEFGDDGIGMTAETLKRIFDPFFTTRLGQGGSGLGLSIVHNLVCSLLGGTIEVQSAPGQGTRFTMQLPLYAPRTGEP